MLVPVAASLLRYAGFLYGLDIRSILTLTTEEDGNGSSTLQVIIDIAPRTLYSYLTTTVSFTILRTFLQLAPSLISTLEPGPHMRPLIQPFLM